MLSESGNKLRILALAGAASFALSAAPALAAPVFHQGFETDTSGWTAGGDYGSITRVASGVGVTSYEGGHHAIVTESNAGPYTFFGGASNTFPAGGYSAQIAVYLDTGWSAGSGFDYSVASNTQSGGHLRDFIFHVTKDTSTGMLLVGGSNNSGGGPKENLENGNHHVVTDSGWYVFEHVFYDLGGTLAVDLNLRDEVGNLLFTETRNTAADDIATIVGGNRYGWFVNVAAGNGLAIDDVSLNAAGVPEPATAALFGLGLPALGLARRRRAA